MKEKNILSNRLYLYMTDFFDQSIDCPSQLNELIQDLKGLDEKQIASLHELVKGLHSRSQN